MAELFAGPLRRSGAQDRECVILLPVGDPERLDAEERSKLEREGYVLRREVFDPDELRVLREACDDLIARLLAGRRRRPMEMGSYVFEVDPDAETAVKWERDAPDVVLGIEPFAHLGGPLEACARDARFTEPMKDVVGAFEVTLYTEKLNLKRPEKGGPIALHQDYPYWADVADDASRIGTAILFLDDADRPNGCLEVAPGSHREGVRPGKSEKGFGSFEMDPAKFDVSRLVPLEVEAGSVVMLGPLLVHASAPNRSESERRVLLYSYQPAGLRHSRAFIHLGRPQELARRR